MKIKEEESNNQKKKNKILYCEGPNAWCYMTAWLLFKKQIKYKQKQGN